MSTLLEQRRQASPSRVLSGSEPRGLLAAPSSLAVHRAISVVAVLGLMLPLLNAWGQIVSDPALGIAVVAMTAGGLWLVADLACARTEQALSRLDRWLLVLGLLVLAATTAARLAATSGYGTDEASFEQSAASLLLHGHDPYGVNLSSALAAFSTPSSCPTAVNAAMAWFAVFWSYSARPDSFLYAQPIWNWAVSAIRAASFSSREERWRLASARSKGRDMGEKDSRRRKKKITRPSRLRVKRR